MSDPKPLSPETPVSLDTLAAQADHFVDPATGEAVAGGDSGSGSGNNGNGLGNGNGGGNNGNGLGNGGANL